VNIVSTQFVGVIPRLAETMAMGTAISRVMSNDPRVRYRVLIATLITSLKTGSPVRMDVPKFPLMIFPSHDRYWKYQAADPPESLRAAVPMAADAVCPLSKLLNGSPGAKNRTMKTTKLTPKSNKAAMASSLEIITVMGLIEASFMVNMAWKKAGYLKRYPAMHRDFK
jgi:hypothetical protein